MGAELYRWHEEPEPIEKKSSIYYANDIDDELHRTDAAEDDLVEDGGIDVRVQRSKVEVDETYVCLVVLIT